MGSTGAVTRISNSVVSQAVQLVRPFTHAVVDMDNKEITIPFDKGITQDDVMQPGMLGAWFKDNGFSISFTKGDYEYTTKDKWRNARGWNVEKGHRAVLRDRLIGKVRW